MTRRLRASASLLLIVAVAVSFSQTANTSLRGVVKDPSDAFIPGAKVVLIDNATGHKFEATTNAVGEYVFAQLAPARYTITVQAEGFGDQNKSAELLVNQPATIDFLLSVRARTEVVDVSPGAQTLNASDASIGNSMNNALIQSLPSEGRNVPDLLSLQPGALYLGQNSGRPSNPSLQNDPRSGVVNGGRSDQGNITVDGLDDNDQVNGYAFTGVLRETQDSIEEFRVTTGLSDAEAGRSSGAQVSMITKSGTNSFHGAAYWYNRPTLTVANDWFNKQAQLNSGEANRPPKLIRNTFGAAVGGPILRNKLFFFANYEGQRQAENQIVTQTVPTASYKQGAIIYQGDTDNGNQIENQTLTSAQIATLDAPCTANGVCPWGPGPNPNVLSYFNQYPTANGTVAGDGLNTGSFTFSSPNPGTLNTSIARIDVAPGRKHQIFVRGNLQKDTTWGTEQFPGQGPSFVLEDNTKGIAAGDTWTITPNLVNDARYAYIRQGYANRGPGTGEYVDLYPLTPLTSENRATIVSVPVNNLIDNFSWNKGRQTFQFGANWRLIHQNHGTDSNSYDSANSNWAWMAGLPPDPSAVGGLSVDAGFLQSYGTAYANLVGAVPQLSVIENYAVASSTAGVLLPEGAFINRSFKANEFEWYIQDSWRVFPNLILTFGLRQTILQTPWETHGQQVAPTIDTHAWYMQRGAAAQAGQVYEPTLAFAPNGPFYHRPGYWPKQKNNFAPRIAVAYSPNPRTTIRAGFGIFFDHYGEELVNTYSQFGSIGLSTTVTNQAGFYGYEDSPRFVDRRTLPPIPLPTPPSSITFPYTFPQGSFALQWGLDSRLKTPYSESIDFSIQRQLPFAFTLEANYVGRLGRHLLQSLDLAEPVDLVDTKSGVDYFTAGAQLSRQVDSNAGQYSKTSTTSGTAVNVQTIPYFENVFPFMAGYDYPGESATEAIYNHEWAPNRSTYGETQALADLDFSCLYGCPLGMRFWQGQFSSIYALSTIGMSYYNAGQLVLRHPTASGLSLDFSYTFSKSIDMGSDVERGTQFNLGGGNFSNIINTWKPYLNRATSDFDTRHLITADWVYQLPFGRGRRFLRSADSVADGLIGGWQLSGISRWTSGLPFSLSGPWATDYLFRSFAVVTGKIQTQKHIVNGAPQVFTDLDAINAGTATGSPVRLAYPGEAGERNNFRGDGVFGIDAGLTKTWDMKEYGAVRFSWEVFNVANSVRFNTNSTTLGQVLANGNLGVYSAMQNLPRRMQFGVRYDF